MTFNDRIEALEVEARGRLRRALATGNEKLMELDGALARLAEDDWTAPAVRRQVDQLRRRAERLREDAVKRAAELPGQAVTRIVNGTRAPIQTLARGFADAARRFEEPARPAPRVVPDPVDESPEPKSVATGSG